MTFKLNDEQSAAVEAMLAFLASPDESFFLLEGPAGTGKTFCIQDLLNHDIGRTVFTAPTNKAVRVLRETLESSDCKPETKTIYSLLGLRLEPNGEVRELKGPERNEAVDLSEYSVVIGDEASMMASILLPYIKDAARNYRLKFIFMGDPYQLPPVGEDSSPIWKLAQRKASLTRVMRYDNQILKLATSVRNEIMSLAPQFKRRSDNSGGEGVWDLGSTEFMQRVLEAAANGEFSQPADSKAIAWRNVTVNELNRLIRFRIFNEAAAKHWLPEDRLAVREPAKDLEGNLVAFTDDEGVVRAAVEDWHPYYPEFKVWRLSVTLDDGRLVVLNCLHPDSAQDFKSRLDGLAVRARTDRKLWREFWALRESFHQAAHGYAITAHRSQGSTYNSVYVQWSDILRNTNRAEAFRCLYVACTRPKKRLFLGA